MKKIIFITLILITKNLQSQSYIGIPFLDKCKKRSACDVCNPKFINAKTTAYLDSIETVFVAPEQDLIFLDREIIRYGKMAAIRMSELTHEKEVYARLLIMKIKLLSDIGIKDGIVYNINNLDLTEYPDFNGVNEINDMFTELISLNISETTNKSFNELRMTYMMRSGAFDNIDADDSWYYDKKIPKPSKNGFSKDKINAAQLFLEDENSTNYVPFDSYLGLGVGGVGAIGKETWLGFEMSYDVSNSINPFSLVKILSNELNTRWSLFGSSFLWNINDRSKQDILFNVLNLRSPYLNLNLIQFGLHYGIADKGKWLYRPEIGLSYGIFKVSYSYNLTFDKSVRSQTEKSLFTFGISYPLVRIGRYFYN